MGASHGGTRRPSSRWTAHYGAARASPRRTRESERFVAASGPSIRGTGGGATANDHVVITIADGNPDFAAGDSFSITVTPGDYEVLDPAEDDGAQIAAGILYASVDASAADEACVVVVRDAEVNQHELTWPKGHLSR